MSSSDLVGKRIAEHLIRTGKSPEEFAGEVGLSNMTIRRLLDAAENPTAIGHRPNLRTRARIAAAPPFEMEPVLLWGDMPAVVKRPRKQRRPRTRRMAKRV